MGTLWERVENLSERVGELEAEVSKRVIADEERASNVDSYALALMRRIESLEAHPERLGSSEKHFDRRLERLERHVEKLEASGVPLPPPEHRDLVVALSLHEERMREAVSLLARLAAGTWQTSDLALPRDVKVFLARARVAGEKP